MPLIPDERDLRECRHTKTEDIYALVLWSESVASLMFDCTHVSPKVNVIECEVKIEIFASCSSVSNYQEVDCKWKSVPCPL
jgi:hypothetical protein